MTARDVVQTMIKELKNTSEYVDNMSFKDIAKIDTSIQERYCLILEKKALDENHIDLHLCKGFDYCSIEKQEQRFKE
jgi:hypothetical protein